MSIAIYTITSPLHDEAAVNAATRCFLDSLDLTEHLVGNDFDTYGTHDLDLIYIRTGGAEGIFAKLLPQLRRQSPKPIHLLTSGQSNSLAASLEILSYLNGQGIAGEIIHGTTEYVKSRVAQLAAVAEARRRLQGQRLGIIGKPSDWLIASGYDTAAVARRLGIELVEIEMDEVLKKFNSAFVTHSMFNQLEGFSASRAVEERKDAVNGALTDSMRLYVALRQIVDEHRLNGFTIRCFDLLTAVRNTGCLALSRLNGEGIVAGCEGDVPTMLTMAIANALTGKSGFQANPAAINPETGEITFAHCTLPWNMIHGNQYLLDTHFESGIGVAVHGKMAEGPVTILKVSGDLSRTFCAEAELIRNQYEPNLCRTQIVVRLDNPAEARYFLTRPIGNHHVVAEGSLKTLIADFTATL